MRCFYHGEVEAVAICKACQRGLCHECCTDVGTTSACRGRCEPEVERLLGLLARNVRAYQTNKTTFFRSGIFVLIMGAFFIGMGVFSMNEHGGNYFFFVLGALFVLFGVSQIFTARRWGQK